MNNGQELWIEKAFLFLLLVGFIVLIGYILAFIVWFILYIIGIRADFLALWIVFAVLVEIWFLILE